MFETISPGPGTLNSRAFEMTAAFAALIRERFPHLAGRYTLYDYHDHVPNLPGAQMHMTVDLSKHRTVVKSTFVGEIPEYAMPYEWRPVGNSMVPSLNAHVIGGDTSAIMPIDEDAIAAFNLMTLTKFPELREHMAIATVIKGMQAPEECAMFEHTNHSTGQVITEPLPMHMLPEESFQTRWLMTSDGQLITSQYCGPHSH